MQWRTADGVLHKQIVSLEGKGPPNFEGILYFEILGDNSVRVEARPDVGRE